MKAKGVMTISICGSLDDDEAYGREVEIEMEDDLQLVINEASLQIEIFWFVWLFTLIKVV